MAIFPIEQPPLVVPGATGWLDSFDTAAGVVSSWINKANAQTAATAAGSARPTCTANQLGGNNTLLFNGSNNLALPSSIYSVAAGDNTLLAVCKINSTGAQQRVITLGQGATTKYTFEYGSDASSIGYASHNAAGGSVTIASTQTNYNILACYRTGTTQSIQLNNGTAVTNTQGVDSTGLDGGFIGQSLSGTVLLTGVIAELIFYPYALSATNILYLVRYLSRKWGMTIS